MVNFQNREAAMNGFGLRSIRYQLAEKRNNKKAIPASVILLYMFIFHFHFIDILYLLSFFLSLKDNSRTTEYAVSCGTLQTQLSDTLTQNKSSRIT